MTPYIVITIFKKIVVCGGIVLALIFMSMINLELISVCGVRKGFDLIFCLWISSCYPLLFKNGKLKKKTKATKEPLFNGNFLNIDVV